MLCLIIILLLVTALFIFLELPALRRHPDIRVLTGIKIAHRGLHDIFDNTPENSLEAFKAAADMGYAIENDIHITRDGEVVVFHDDTLERMCGINRKIEDMTLAEIQKCRLSGTDCKIPTLRECLDTVNGRVPLLIEFKCSISACKKLCIAADKILSEYSGKYFVQSFYPPVLYWYRKHRKSICRGQLSTAFYGRKLYMELLGCMLFNFLSRPDFVSYEHKHRCNIFRRLNTRLGALPVGWTYTSQQDIDNSRSGFKSFIFESFIPNDK